MTLVIPFQFSAAHFYKTDLWSSEKNELEYGACFDPQEKGHGHNFTGEIELKIMTNPSTEEKNTDDFDNLLKEIKKRIQSIIAELNFKHLNFQVPNLSGKNPTCEAIAHHITKSMTSLAIRPVSCSVFESAYMGATYTVSENLR